MDGVKELAFEAVCHFLQIAASTVSHRPRNRPANASAGGTVVDTGKM